MKIQCSFFLILVYVSAAISLHAQSNTFPSSGSVGIGTTSPDDKLHIFQGQVRFEAVGGSPPALKTMYATGTTSSPSVVPNGDFLFYIGAGGYNGTSTYALNRALIGFRTSEAWTSTKNGTSITFEITPNASITRKRAMRIDHSGMVGIGTDTPTHPLTVNGAIRAKEIIVDTGWADYVFLPDYKLPALAEVEAHIKQKGHLPGIPSEQEVKANGVELGDMQVRLLAQIEQLNLHLIAQEKRLQAQEARIRELEAK